MIFLFAALLVAATPLDHGTRDPTVSPDGSTIAASILGRIYLIPIAGGEARPISDGIGWDSHPAFSPDGRFLAYAHEMPSGAELVVYSRSIGTTSSLYHTDAALGQIAYSPAGGELFFLLDRNQLDSHLWRIPVSGGKPKQVTFTEGWHEWSFALSPDGRQTVIDSGRFGGSNLYRIDLSDLKVARLTHSRWHQSSVEWSRDGATLAYIETANGVESVMVGPAASETARPVFSSEYSQKQIALAPDGKSAVLCAARKLYRLDLVSGKTNPIAFQAEVPLPQQSAPDLVIVNARLFDGGKQSDVAPGSTIEIRDGRIASVHQAVHPDSGRGRDAAQVIDAGGKFVMSGLIDNHYHYWSPFAGAALIRNGITAIRDPGVGISTSMDFREANSLSLKPGPKIYSCGPLIDGLGGYHPLVDVELDRADAAPGLLGALKAQGADCAKVYFMLPPDILSAAVKAAHGVHLPVTGHIGVRTGWREAMEAGIDGLTHIRVWKDFLPAEKQPQGENENLDGSKNPVPRMQADWSGIDPDGAQAEALIEMMRQHHVGFDPTLAIQQIGEGLRQRFSLEQFSTAQDTARKMGRFVARAQRAGVMLLAGTDNGSLFDELEAYAGAGVPNAEILRAASSNGARWLGKESEFGTVEPGKRGDLIIIDGDPLKQMKDLRKITMVVQSGRIVFEK
ncbi:MAG: amidohydrolase family protein [Bryobacteraceae bacterium]